MQRRLFSALLIFLIVVCSTAAILAAGPIPQPTKEFYVADRADMLSSTTEAEIIRMANALHDKTKAQVVVATEPSLNGYTIEKYAEQIFQAWKIGDRDLDNGVLLLIVKNDRKFRIEVGYGLEGAIPDSRAAAILNGMTNLFRENKFDQGTLQAFNQIVSMTAAEYQLDAKSLGVTQTAVQANPGDAQAILLTGLLVLLVLGIIVIGVIALLAGGGDWSVSSGGSSSSSDSSTWSSSSDSSSSTGGGGSSGGGGASGGW